MAKTEDTQGGFGTGLRAALARARDARDAPSDDPAAAAEVVSPELALVSPELRPAQAAQSAAAE